MTPGHCYQLPIKPQNYIFFSKSLHYQAIMPAATSSAAMNQLCPGDEPAAVFAVCNATPELAVDDAPPLAMTMVDVIIDEAAVEVSEEVLASITLLSSVVEEGEVVVSG